MEFTEILVSSADSIGVITLNSPKTINSLSKIMVGELYEAFKRFESDRSVKVIVLKAEGKHFCAGHNLREMVQKDMAEYKLIFDRCTDLMNLIHEIPQPVIAQVHGVATAAGCQLAATCDLVVADETAKFGLPGVRIGLFCSTPIVALSRCVGRKRALEMGLTGELISASVAERYGLVNRVVAEADLESATMELARSIAQRSGLVLGIGKRGFYAQVEQDERRAYELAKTTMAMAMMAEDAQEGVSAFIEKRDPTWKER